jgi:hypothetical protein
VCLTLILCRTCRDWNRGNCSKQVSGDFCGSGRDKLRHGCGKIVSANQICWSREHKEKDCDR